MTAQTQLTTRASITALAAAQRAVLDAGSAQALDVAAQQVRELLGADIVLVATPEDDRLVVRAVSGSGSVSRSATPSP